MHLLNASRDLRRSRPLALEALEDRMLPSYSFHLIADDGPNSPFTL
jgi:hypothetical protein